MSLTHYHQITSFLVMNMGWSALWQISDISFALFLKSDMGLIKVILTPYLYFDNKISNI